MSRRNVPGTAAVFATVGLIICILGFVQTLMYSSLYMPSSFIEGGISWIMFGISLELAGIFLRLGSMRQGSKA